MSTLYKSWHDFYLELLCMFNGEFCVIDLCKHDEKTKVCGKEYKSLSDHVWYQKNIHSVMKEVIKQV